LNCLIPSASASMPSRSKCYGEGGGHSVRLCCSLCLGVALNHTHACMQRLGICEEYQTRPPIGPPTKQRKVPNNGARKYQE
jgi:hypothetical protein